jgi:RpiR family carbohydrate utilization transcriptional regulator
MLSRIEQNRQALSAAERRVADWVLDNPHRVVSLPLARIAAAARVSEPTVVRFCRSVGSKGFSDFKVRVAQYLAAGQTLVHADVRPGDDASDILAKVMGGSIRELSSVQRSLDPSRIEQAVSLLLEARRIDFFGVGASGIVVQDALNKFFRLGVPCAAYYDAPTILQAGAIADETHAVIAVSKTGDSLPVVEACLQARRNGARVIALTSPMSPLAAAARLAILLDVREDTNVYTPMSSRLAQLAVLDVLQVAYALNLGAPGIEKLKRAKIALERTL